MNNETKQTAVEWYAIELANYLKDMYGSGIVHVELLTKAKEMEKEEMIEFAWECQEMFKHQIIEKFNETYGGNK